MAKILNDDALIGKLSRIMLDVTREDRHDEGGLTVGLLSVVNQS